MVFARLAGTAVMWLCLPVLVSAQAPQVLAESSQFEVFPLVSASVGSPEILAGGFLAFLGRSHGVSARHTSISAAGVLTGMEIGPGGMTGRIGLARLSGNDVAGLVGGSIDAIYVRTWERSWGLQRHASYFGGGVTGLAGPFRLSIALVAAERDVEPRVGVSAKLGLIIPVPSYW